MESAGSTSNKSKNSNMSLDFNEAFDTESKTSKATHARRASMVNPKLS